MKQRLAYCGDTGIYFGAHFQLFLTESYNICLRFPSLSQITNQINWSPSSMFHSCGVLFNEQSHFGG